MSNRSTAREVKIADRRRQVSDLYLGGETQPQIAARLKVSQPTISLDLQYLQKQWLNAALMDFNEAKSRELARIDRLEREYWQAWQRSLTEQVKTSKRAKERPTGKEIEAGENRESRIGDERFLAGVRWCIEQRLKIFGVYAADKSQNDWRKEILEMLKAGKVTLEDVRTILGAELYTDFFKSSGAYLVEVGAVTGAGAGEAGASDSRSDTLDR